jgi:site-specific DNA recombinase
MSKHIAARRVAIYARFSSDLQNPTSADDQIAVCERYAAAKGWQVVARFKDEGISGTTRHRPQYQAMLRQIDAGAFDLVLAEAMDRFSRDQADSHELSKKCRFRGVELHTKHEGSLDNIRLTISSLLNSEQIEKLREQVRRGAGERVRNGRSAGGLGYGYRVPRKENGDRLTGELEIVPEEAATIRRVFADYAAGKAPKAIAIALNDDNVPAPGGGLWKMNTILGNRARGTGILNNELYVGERVWNRLTYCKDPETGRKVSRPNPPEMLVRVSAPELRIVPQDLWNAVKARQEAHDRKRAAVTAAGADKRGLGASQALRRPRYLLSGLLRCGLCDGPMTIVGSGFYYCAGSHEKGPRACRGMKGIKARKLEAMVLDLLRDHLMQPEAVAAFLEDYRAQHQAATAALVERQKSGRKALERMNAQIANLTDLLADGDRSVSLRTRHRELEAKATALAAELAASSDAILPDLPDDLAERYRAKVMDLTATLAAPGQVTEAALVLRGLIEKIVITPGEGKSHQIELIGDLPALLSLASQTALDGRRATNDNAAAIAAAGNSIKLVAGAGFEPATFRL